LDEPRVICFDADETLIDFRSAMHQALRSALRRIQASVPGAESLSVERLVKERDTVAAEMGTRASMEAIRLEAFRRSLSPFAVAADVVSAVTEEYLADRFRLAHPYPDVVPTLNVLSSRYVLGLATNGNSYPDRVGLAGYFSFAVYAHECGHRKPDLGFFEAVHRAAAHEPSEIVYVGDSLDEDIVGAKRAGLSAVWINRKGASGASSLADAVISSLSELPALLDAPN
jgi:HAD superfamily hydrolase (TIGR01509 family)